VLLLVLLLLLVVAGCPAGFTNRMSPQLHVRSLAYSQAKGMCSPTMTV
jgi:hypothetical protein